MWDLAATCNSLLGGLVSITAGCSTVDVWASIVIGLVGAIVYHGVLPSQLLPSIRARERSTMCPRSRLVHHAQAQDRRPARRLCRPRSLRLVGSRELDFSAHSPGWQRASAFRSAHRLYRGWTLLHGGVLVLAARRLDPVREARESRLWHLLWRERPPARNSDRRSARLRPSPSRSPHLDSPLRSTCFRSSDRSHAAASASLWAAGEAWSTCLRLHRLPCCRSDLHHPLGGRTEPRPIRKPQGAGLAPHLGRGRAKRYAAGVAALGGTR